MICALSVAEHDTLHRKLRELPDTMPPRAVWQRIEEQAKAEGLFTDYRILGKLKWISGAAIAATVAMLALKLPFSEAPVIDALPPAGTEPANAMADPHQPRDLNALKVESQILERNLRLLPQDPAVMKVSTASTIRDLEERIAAIDYRLNDHTVRLDPQQEEVYWRERVRLMNILVQLRYAQAQRMSF